MCVFKQPKVPEIKNVIPVAPSQPQKAPEPVEIKKDGQERMKRRRNPLRIDMATGGGASGMSSNTGVNV